MVKIKHMVTGTLSAAALAGGMWGLSVLSNPSFEQAKRFKFLRPRYLENILNQDMGETMPPYLEKAGYVNNQEEDGVKRMCGADQDAIMVTYGGEMEADKIGRKKIKSNVFVFPGAFGCISIKTGEDFRNMLIDHEIEGHAKHYYEGFPEIPKLEEREGIDPDVFDVVSELSALRNEISRFEKRQASASHREWAMTYYAIYYCSLWSPEVEEGLDPDRLKNLRVFFFDGWMANSSAINKKDIKYFVRDPKTDKWHELPEDLSARLNR